MTTPVKFLTGLLAVVAIFVGIVLYAGFDDEDPAGPGGNGPVTTRSSKGEGSTQKTNGKEAQPESRRTKIGDGGSEVEAAQGVFGLVVAEHRVPVAGAKVYLMVQVDPQSPKFLLQRQGVSTTAIADATTNASGGFRLEIKDWTASSKYDLRVVHDDYCDSRKSDIEVRSGNWSELAEIRLQKGTTVVGQVTTKDGAAVKGALVSIQDTDAVISMVPTPGRERGRSAISGAEGKYRIPHLNPAGVYSMTVTAGEFATETRLGMQLERGKDTRADFKLSAGLAIGGTLKDTGGKPVVDATVTVASLMPRAPHSETTKSNDNGVFLARGLKQGFYVVKVAANGFESEERKPVRAGQNIEMTLTRRGVVTVTVLNKNKQPQPNYHCHVRVAFEGQDSFSNPLLVVHVAGAADGKTTIDSLAPLDSGTYVVEIVAPEHARAYSKRFTIQREQQVPLRLTVALGEGGAIHGFIKGQSGKPVAGVAVSVAETGYQGPLTVKTSETGEFKIALLRTGTHSMAMEHADYSVGFRGGIKVTAGQTTELGDLVLDPGCIVAGSVTVTGSESGNIEVRIRAKDGTPDVNCNAVTDKKGHFRLDKRLAPGEYTVSAARKAESNPLVRRLQFDNSKKAFAIRRGQKSLTLDVQID